MVYVIGLSNLPFHLWISPAWGSAFILSWFRLSFINWPAPHDYKYVCFWCVEALVLPFLVTFPNNMEEAVWKNQSCMRLTEVTRMQGEGPGHRCISRKHVHNILILIGWKMYCPNQSILLGNVHYWKLHALEYRCPLSSILASQLPCESRVSQQMMTCSWQFKKRLCSDCVNLLVLQCHGNICWFLTLFAKETGVMFHSNNV